MKIRHTDGREVDGVQGHFPEWRKDSITYFAGHGWSEVKAPRYVDVTKDCRVLPSERILYTNGGGDIIFPFGFRPIIKQWFDLPENLLHDIHSMTVKGFIEYIQRFKKPCLIVEKEE